MAVFSLKQKVGAVLLDLPRLIWHLKRSASGWIRYENRQDQSTPAPDGSGLRCDWTGSRQLHLCTVFPLTARWLLQRTLQDCPIQLADRPERIHEAGACGNGEQSRDSGPPEISLIIGHRGVERLPHLLLVLRSIAAQQDVRFECIVVEQDVNPVIRDSLPEWVRYIHTPPPDAEMLYCRSWAFNVGAREAKAPYLIFHDNDFVIPAGYAAEVLSRFKQGAEVVNLKRFMFYLTRQELSSITRLDGAGCSVSHVVENLEAGGSLAVSRDAFDAIGGFDEEFVGWGGEDIECWDRCLTRKVWEYTYLPLLHLWHEAQEGRRAVGGLGLHTVELTNRRRAMAPEDRIAELISRPRGASSWAKVPSFTERSGLA